jgi:hypothetical protein
VSDIVDEHILNRTTVMFLYNLTTKNKRTSVPDPDTLNRMEAEGWIRCRAGKLPTITPKGEIVIALLKAKAGVA